MAREDAVATEASAAQDLITQTDASGKPLRQDLAAPPKKSDCVPCLFNFFCCLNLERNFQPLLPEQRSGMKGKKTLILDLDETLVHSSFEPVDDPDFKITVNIKGAKFDVYVIKRPGVDEFLTELAKHYELVIFTASLPKYAIRVLDVLDESNVIEATLFRDSCTLHEGNYVKDLSLVGRDLQSTIIVDNSIFSYQFQPENAIGISTFTNDKNDRELYHCKDFLIELANLPDVRHKGGLGRYNEYIKEIEKVHGKVTSSLD